MLIRCGKKWQILKINYFGPDIKIGDISPDDDNLIIRMHALLGN